MYFALNESKPSIRLLMVSVWMFAATAITASEPAKPGTAIDAQALGRENTKLFYEKKIDDVWKRFSPAMQSALGSVDGLKAFREKVGEQLGDEQSVVSEEVADGTYTRHARFAKVPTPIVVSWTFDAKGAVEGFFIRPQQKEAETTRLEYKTKSDLQLPFEGSWFVFWGGRTMSQNYHTVSPQQRFAYDILIMKGGKSHIGDGKKNEDYYCFGQPIFAPAASTVVATASDVADNVPGVLNPAQLLGNHVILDHGNGEFSFLVHFKQASVKVNQGQAVKTGELLGLCGNSGNSSESHLHYHLQTTADIKQGEGLPAQFQNYLADDKPVKRGEPVKGQVIQRK